MAAPRKYPDELRSGRSGWRSTPGGIRSPGSGHAGGGIDDLGIATAKYIDWFNHRRLHGEIGLVPAAEFEELFHQRNIAAASVAASVPSLH